MTRIELLPGAPMAAPGARMRRLPCKLFREPKPMKRRERDELAPRIERYIERLIDEGRVAERFGVFAIKKGSGRVFAILNERDPNYARQLRAERLRLHCVGVYDGAADLADVWDDLCNFDRGVA